MYGFACPNTVSPVDGEKLFEPRCPLMLLDPLVVATVNAGTGAWVALRIHQPIQTQLPTALFIWIFRKDAVALVRLVILTQRLNVDIHVCSIKHNAVP